MRRIARITLLATAGLLAAISLAARGWAIPPLSLDGYRDEKLATGKDESSALDEMNGGCYVCHGNYRTESLVTSHAKEKVGCIKCHGQSLPHQADETHRTPPEKMYGPRSIDTMCADCHEEHEAPASKIIARWQQRCPAKTDPRQIVCTDCHFEHRLHTRAVIWDKKTGKLLVYNKEAAAAAGKKK